MAAWTGTMASAVLTGSAGAAGTTRSVGGAGETEAAISGAGFVSGTAGWIGALAWGVAPPPARLSSRACSVA
jgi:hypothetical protein